MASFDVLVIGGGPAGATSALLLARAGRKAALIEKTAFPRRKVCGEYIAPPAVAFLHSLGIPAEERVRRIAVWANNRSLQAPLPAPYASTLAREDLDTVLLEKAREAGATVFQPLKALALEKSSSGLICKTESVEIEARTVVAAHGSWEPGALPTQHRRGEPKASDLLAFKAHFRGAAFDAHTIALVPFPGGYGGVLQLDDGRATFACCLRRDALEALREPGMAAGESVFRHTLRTSTEFKNYFGNAKLQGPWLASGPLRAGSRPLHRDGIFAAGNAAGEVHPLIGSGISMAMRSASILSPLLDAALRGEMTMDAAARAYEMQWRAEFARRLFWSSCFVRLVGRASPARLVAHAPWLLTLAAKVSS
jgi:flavin-dependent dehydrogenase